MRDFLASFDWFSTEWTPLSYAEYSSPIHKSISDSIFLGFVGLGIAWGPKPFLPLPKWLHLVSSSASRKCEKRGTVFYVYHAGH